MDKFEEFIVKKYPNRSAKVLLHKLQDKDDTWFYAVKEVQDQSEAWQSRQADFDSMTEALLNQTQLLAKQKAEINQLQSQINEMAEVGLSQESVIKEKDKRIESALYALKGLKAENDLWGCDQVEAQIDVLEKALRGGHG